MRFQPRLGQLLAAASDKVVSIFDVETNNQMYSFKVYVYTSSSILPIE